MLPRSRIVTVDDPAAGGPPGPASPARPPTPTPTPPPATRPRPRRRTRRPQRARSAAGHRCSIAAHGSDQPAPPRPPSAARAARPRGDRRHPLIEGIADAFRGHGYIAERSLATTVFLALELGRPLLLEGEAGVGKTELAKVLASIARDPADPPPVLRGPGRQHGGLRVELPAPDARDPAARGPRRDRQGPAHDIFGPEFLLKRPLLQALEADDGAAPVLLIDEIDRADEEFEAYLLEILSDFQVTVPEIGTIRAASRRAWS